MVTTYQTIIDIWENFPDSIESIWIDMTNRANVILTEWANEIIATMVQLVNDINNVWSMGGLFEGAKLFDQPTLLEPTIRQNPFAGAENDANTLMERIQSRWEANKNRNWMTDIGDAIGELSDYASRKLKELSGTLGMEDISKSVKKARDYIEEQTEDIEKLRTEISLVGEGAIARAKYLEILKAEQKIRELNIPLYGKEAQEIRKNAQEIANLTEQLTKANFAADQMFRRRQAGRTDEEAQIASELRAAGFKDDLNSAEAAVIRQTIAVERLKETWNEVFDTINEGIDSFVDALFDGTTSIEDALRKLGRDIARQFFDLAVTNPLKNWLTGANQNTIADLGIFGSGATSGRGGGFGGILGKLFGADKALSTASMSVTAGTVIVNGSITGAGGIQDIINKVHGKFTAEGSQKILDQLGSGGFKTAAQAAGATGTAPFEEMVAYAKQAAASRGMDVDTALKVLRSEGLQPGTWQSNVINKLGMRETSFGPGQLLKGGGLGDVFEKQTGLDVTDPANWRQNIDFTFDQAIKRGWTPWHGAAAAGIGAREGLPAPGTLETVTTVSPAGTTGYPMGDIQSTIQSRIDTAFEPAQETIQNRINDAFSPAQETIQNRINDAFAPSQETIQGRINDAFGPAQETIQNRIDSAFGQTADSVDRLIESTDNASTGLTDLGSKASNLMNMFPSAPATPSGNLSSWFSSLFGGPSMASMTAISPGAAGAIAAGGALGPAGLYHTGGTAGYATTTRSVEATPAQVAAAPRYHEGTASAGLKPDEVLSVLKRGEPVFPSWEKARDTFANDNTSQFDASQMGRELAKHMKAPKIINVMDPGVVGNYLTTEDGQDLIMNLIRKTGHQAIGLQT
jgi:hypothetical protein